MPNISTRLNNFTDSVIRRMTRIARSCDAINLSQGFPDFDPPAELTQALARVAGEGPHQYEITWGSAKFRSALAAKQTRFMGLPIDPETNIVVTCGRPSGRGPRPWSCATRPIPPARYLP